MDVEAIKKKSIVYEIVDRLTEVIQSEAMRPGDRLPSERQLCESFEVSRSSLRTALKQLEYNGLLVIKPNSGVYISENALDVLEQNAVQAQPNPPLTDSKELFLARMECRVAMEPTVARLAAIYATEEDLQELRQILNRMESCTDSSAKGFYVEDQKFHDCIARASKNEFMREIINHYCVNIKYHLKSFGRIPNHIDISSEHHKQIVTAIEDRDPAAAEAAMLNHVLYSFHTNAKYIYGVKSELRKGVLK